MTLADLIDLEAQLARDRAGDPSALAARDRALMTSAGAIGSAPVAGRRKGPPSRAALLCRWLEELRAAEPGGFHPGRAVAAALRAVALALALAGLALGWTTAAALLGYNGREPVNVWDFLLVFVGLQIALLVLLFCSFFLPVRALGAPFFGLARGLLAFAYPRLAARFPPARAADWRAFWHHLRSRRSLYHRIEPWILLGLTQGFGVAFNVGALLGCLRIIAFSDIAFSWSTTLVQLDAGRFHALVRAVAAPFGWLWPDSVPSRALVEATRYSRLEGIYLLAGARRAAHPELVGGFWPFLLSALACYGLLPRAVALLVSRLRAARLLSRLPFDDAEVERAVRRLSEPHLDARGAGPVTPPRESTQPSALAPEVAPAGSRCVMVLWRDAPSGPGLQDSIVRQTGWSVAAVHAAGGRDYEDGREDWSRLLGGVSCAAVVAEGWEAPDKAALRLLADLRRGLGERRHLRVLLARMGAGRIGPAPADEVRLWAERLASLEDPYLAVEPLAETA
ncbi:MAG: hypothetical protein NVS4B10_23310 [Myxococcales bacterium]